MKKIVLAAVILTGSMAFMSCKKNYTCECSIDTYVNNVAISSVTTSTTIKDTKSKAKKQCEVEVSLIILGSGTETSCKIK